MWFMGEIVGDEKNEFQESEMWNTSVALSAFHICLVCNFSAQWREDTSNTPNVILGCFRGLGKR